MSSRTRLVQLIAAIGLVAICLHLFFFTFTSGPPRLTPHPDPGLGNGVLNLDPDVHIDKSKPAPVVKLPAPECTPVQDLSRPPVDPEPAEPGDRLEFLRKMVSKTKGYYVRDWSLGLGWNNMRYIIEASLMHATTINRTLVLPSFVYARACEHHISVCQQFTYMVNRGDAIGWNDWRDLPIEEQMGFRIPIGLMLNVTHMRTKYNVLDFHDYLDLHNLSRNIEWGSGAWDRNGYLNTKPDRISFSIIPNDKYDPKDIIRVDTYPDTGKEIVVKNKALGDRLKATAGDAIVLDWEKAMKALRASSDAEGEQLVKDAGWVTLWTFAPFLGMEFVKSPVWPARQVAPHSVVRGLREEFGGANEEVVLLAGETHLNRKPGSLRFSTRKALDDYMRLCLYDLRYLDKLHVVARRAGQRMTEKVKGRMWMAAQMRRGDFAKLGWAMEKTIEGHFQRIQDRLRKGREVIIQLLNEKNQTVFEIPDVSPHTNFFYLDPPDANDPFYLATDERSPDGLQYAKEHGAIFISDLITYEDRQYVGWPLLVTDVSALLEQLVMAQSEYFYGHAMSSVAGGVVNMRAARGVDSRTYLID